MTRWLRHAMVPLLVLTLVAAGCAQDDDDAAAPGETRRLSIRIGAVFPLTGALSDFGPAGVRALELGRDYFQEKAREAGQEISVELFIEDSQTDAAAGVEAARKLVDTDGVHAILGGYASSVTIPVAESVTIPNNIVQCSPASTSGDITNLEDNGLVFRTPPSDEHQAPILASLVVDELGTDTRINLGARNDAYGTFLIDGVEEQLNELGASVGSKTLWNPDAPTFDSEANEIVSGDPGGWVLIDFPGTWQKMGPALVRTGNWSADRTFSADGLKISNLPERAGPETANGMKGTAPGGTEAFNQLWEERVLEVNRETFDAHSFDCLMLLLLSAVAANSNDPQEIAAQMTDVSGPGGTRYTFEDLDRAIADLANGEDIDYAGASGPINFDENGDPQSERAVYELYEFVDGEMRVFETRRVGEDGGESPAPTPE